MFTFSCSLLADLCAHQIKIELITIIQWKNGNIWTNLTPEQQNESL